ncbi:TPA: methionine--tRNA ligase [Candidatus Uhrbacteria bacterium]|nr:methionine--tRNA ligase [Candidatus Uhrbacteria bacterium]
MKFSLTTPIYYVNGAPHIGHAYTTIAGDVIAQYRRLLGDDVFYLTGTDENAQKNVEASGGSSREDVQAYVDKMSGIWEETWKRLHISHDDFIRTTEARHIEFVEQFWKKVEAKGDIYKGTYEGLYCTGCEAYKTEAELAQGLCPDHKRAPEKLSEENYFFKLSAYRERLLDYIAAHPEFIQPASRRHEIVSYIRDFAGDFSISRKNLEWGIPVPGDLSQTIYVWFDALINYISADPSRWPVDLHLVGKDIIKFHCAYWPAMLMSAGYELPKTVFAHGFFTIDGEKMSKSLGNVIDPVELVEQYGNDVVRFHLLREIPFGSDGDFSTQRLVDRYNGELGNDLGNLLQRTLTMTEKFCEGKAPAIHAPLSSGLGNPWNTYTQAMETFRLHDALETAWSVIRWMNAVIDEKKPWAMAKEGRQDDIDEVIYTLLESLRMVAWMLRPFMPETSTKMLASLGFDEDVILKTTFLEAQVWGGLPEGQIIRKGEPLFPRLG